MPVWWDPSFVPSGWTDAEVMDEVRDHVQEHEYPDPGNPFMCNTVRSAVRKRRHLKDQALAEIVAATLSRIGGSNHAE